MKREVGEPVQVGQVGSGTFTVGITVKNDAGAIRATGNVFVTLPDGGDYTDEQSMRSAAKSLGVQSRHLLDRVDNEPVRL
jgi:hypothetical protein